MNRQEYYGGPDWWSRIMAFGALIAAGASLYLVYEQSRQTLPRDEQLAHFNASVDRWDRQAESEFSAIREAGARELNTQRDRLDALYAELEETGSSLAGRGDLANNMTPVTSVPGESPPRDQSADPNGLFNLDRNPPMEAASETGTESDPIEVGREQAGDVAEQSLGGGPKLAVITKAFRSPEGQVTRAVIRNSGDDTAVIDEVYFVPQLEVPVPDDVGQRPDLDSGEIALIQFARTDNASQIKGSHGAYRRQLGEPVKLAPGDELEIDVEIQNRDHTGWGLMGELTLVSGADTLTVEQATAVFRAADEA